MTPGDATASSLDSYLRILGNGGVVACPTETLFGLLADATQPAAVDRVVQLKGRGSGDPIAVMLPNVAALNEVAREVPTEARELMERHWPGPLTLVCQAQPGLPEPLLSQGRIGVRVPGESAALELVRAFGRPVTATSANRTGQPPAHSAAEVRRVLAPGPDAVVPGHAPGGAPSTVVDVTVSPFRVLRPGAVHLPDLEDPK